MTTTISSDNDDLSTLAALDMSELLELLHHTMTQLSSLLDSNASISSLLAPSKTELRRSDDAEESIELDEADRRELHLALRENADIIVRKKTRLVNLIETYELKSHTKGSAARTSRGEAAMPLDKAHALLQRACEYSDDFVVQTRPNPSLSHGEDENDGISL